MCVDNDFRARDDNERESGCQEDSMLVHRVKVDLGGHVIKKQKITHLRPPILRMLVMNFPGKGLLKQWLLSDD